MCNTKGTLLYGVVITAILTGSG